MKIGFLGAGAMGGAILNGAIKEGILAPQDVWVSDFSVAIQERYRSLGCNIAHSNEELGTQSDLIILAVKPQFAAEALKECKDSLSGKTVFSIMAGVTIERLHNMIAREIRVLRIMPNTPALVNAGVFALCNETDITQEERAFAEGLFGALGSIEWMNEHLIDAACGLSGSGPAFVALFIEALSDGAVLEGLPRATATRLAAQTVVGAAKMILETGMHPGQLKDMVSSPGGTTITGCCILEEMGFRAAAIKAVREATRRSREL